MIPKYLTNDWDQTQQKHVILKTMVKRTWISLEATSSTALEDRKYVLWNKVHKFAKELKIN